MLDIRKVNQLANITRWYFPQTHLCRASLLPRLAVQTPLSSRELSFEQIDPDSVPGARIMPGKGMFLGALNGLLEPRSRNYAGSEVSGLWKE